MKKLTRAELEVLANRIHKNIEDAALADQKKIDAASDKKNLKVASVIRQEALGLGTKTRALFWNKPADFNKAVKLSSILKRLRKDKTTITSPNNYRYSNQETLVDVLTIAQINCVDLNTLIERVSKQYGV